MGRTVVADEAALAHRSARSLGTALLIGQVTAQKDYVLFAVSTPEVSATESPSKQSGGSPFEEWWVTEHAREVSSMLPGGVGVVGLLLHCPREQVQPMKPLLAKLLSQICSNDTSSPHSNRLLLHFCTVSKQHKCQTLDLANSQGGFRPAELKSQPLGSQLLKLESSVTLNMNTHIPLGEGRGLQEAIQVGVRPWLEQLSCAAVLVRGRLCPDGDGLWGSHTCYNLVEKCEAIVVLTDGSQITAPSHPLLQPSHPHSPTPHCLDDCCQLSLEGKLYCTAFVHQRATYAEACTALREDAVRSLLTRVNALLKDIEAQEEGEECGDEFLGPHQLPARVLVALPVSPVPLSVYSFPDQPEEELRGDVTEMLGAESETVDLHYVEKFGSLTTPPPLPSTEDKEKRQPEKETVAVFPLVAMVTAVLVAMVAFAIWVLQDS